MKEKLVTILMPVYNSQDYLHEAVASILSQTYSHFEFLIINDGSTDDSANQIRKYKDQRIVFIDNPHNQGLIAVLNQGLQLAKGDYIARMDADDISESTRISKQLNFLERNPSVSVCGTAFRLFSKDKTLRTQTFPSHPLETSTELLFTCSIAHPSVMFRSDFFKQHQLSYNSDYVHAEDYKLWVDCSKIGQLSNLSDTLLHYRLHEKQISFHHLKAQNANRDRILLEKLRFHFHDLSTEECDVFLKSVTMATSYPLSRVKHLFDGLGERATNLSVPYLQSRLRTIFNQYTGQRLLDFYFSTAKPNVPLLWAFHKEVHFFSRHMLSKRYVWFVAKCLVRFAS